MRSYINLVLSIFLINLAFGTLNFLNMQYAKIVTDLGLIGSIVLFLLSISMGMFGLYLLIKTCLRLFSRKAVIG